MWFDPDIDVFWLKSRGMRALYYELHPQDGGSDNAG